MATTSVRIDTMQYRKLRKIAERRQMFLSAVLRKALARYIAESAKA